MKKVIIIRADDSLQVREFEHLNLDELYQSLGDDVYIEGISLPGFGTREDPLRGYIDDEGKLKDLPRNRFATHLYHGAALIGPGVASIPLVPQSGDYIAGDLVITGHIDEEGYDTGVTDEEVEDIQTLRRYALGIPA